MRLVTGGGLICLALLGLVLVGCESGQTEGQKQVDKLSSAIDNVMKDVEGAKAAIQKTLDAHAQIVHNTTGDLLTPFKAFSMGVDEIESYDAKIGESVKEFETVGAAFFNQWKTANEGYDSEDMKKRARDRYETTLGRFKKLEEAAKEGAAAYDPLIVKLKDHRLFFSNDLNKESAAGLAEDDAKIKELSDAVLAALDHVLEFGKSYNEAVAMKTTPPPAPEDGDKPAEGGAEEPAKS